MELDIEMPVGNETRVFGRAETVLVSKEPCPGVLA